MHIFLAKMSCPPKVDYTPVGLALEQGVYGPKIQQKRVWHKIAGAQVVENVKGQKK